PGGRAPGPLVRGRVQIQLAGCRWECLPGGGDAPGRAGQALRPAIRALPAGAAPPAQGAPARLRLRPPRGRRPVPVPARRRPRSACRAPAPGADRIPGSPVCRPRGGAPMSLDLMARQLRDEAYPIVTQVLSDREQLVAQLDLWVRSEEHTSELQSRENLVCRLLLEKKKI